MAEVVKVYQSELKTRPANEAEQAILDERTEKIGKGEMKDDELFDKEEEKPPKEKEEKKEEKKPEELSDADLLETNDKDLNDTQKAKKADLIKAKETVEKEEADKRILETDDKDLKPEEITRKQELVKEKETHKSEEDKKKEFDGEVKNYATEHKVSGEDARKDLESIGKIVDNSKGNARTIAKNYLHVQKAYMRIGEELKALQNAPLPIPEVTVEVVTKAIEAGKIKVKGKSATKEQLVEAYRDRYPEIAPEEVGDETVFKMVVKEVKERLESAERGNVAQLSVKAKEKKDKLVSELSDDAKKFLPEMQPVLDRLSDAQIMSEKFSLEDMILWSKGKVFDKSVKDADERGFKRGVEARKIIGEIKKPAEGKTKTKKGTGDGKTTLNDAQKKEAEEMYANDNIPLTRKYELYEEIVAHDKKLKEDKEKKDKK